MKELLAVKRLSWLLAAAMLSGCSWLGIGEDEEGELSMAELVDFEEEVELDKLWSSGVGGSESKHLASLRPVVSQGVVYAASSDGDVTALDATNGKRLWRVELEEGLSGGVGIGGGSIYVGNREGRLFALNAQDGVQLWQAQLSSEILAPAAGNSEIVAVQAQDGKVFALDAATGEERWSFESETPILTLYGTSAPLVGRRMVFTASAAGKVAGLDATQGTLLWETRITVPRGSTELEKLNDIDGELLLIGELIYVTGYRGSVAALSRSTGRVVWSQESSSYRGPALGNGRLFVVEDDDTIRALRGNGGQQLWANEALALRRLTTPVAFDDYVAVADAEGYLHLLSGEDGRFVGRIKVDGSGVHVPMTFDGKTLYVQDGGGDLTAYQIK